MFVLTSPTGHGHRAQEETANKFVVVGHDFMPELRAQGVRYSDVPPWVIALAAAHEPWQDPVARHDSLVRV